MIYRLQKKFVTAVAATAIAVTGMTAAPARAGNEDVGAALAALLGLAIVGAVIHDQRKDQRARAKVHTPVPHTTPQVAPHPHVKPVHPVRPLPPRVSRKLLPQQCLYNLKHDNGRLAPVFGQRCLNQTYPHVRSLPRECGRRVWTRKGAGYGYGARCLQRHGYEMARR